MDLSESDEVRKFAKDVLDKPKNVDILVNTAGMGPSSGSGPIKGNMSAILEEMVFYWTALLLCVRWL